MKKIFLFVSLLALLLSHHSAYCQVITTFAGDSVFGYVTEGAQATASHILLPAGVAADASGNVFISVSHTTLFPMGAKVLKVNPAGIITTFAGVDTVGFSGDGGPATAARLLVPGPLAFNKKGDVYIFDLYNGRVRKVNAAGIITTVAGNGSATFSGDGGLATAAGLGGGYGMCIDSIGNLYIAAGNRIRKVDTFGIITTFAGTGAITSSGDGGPATAAGIPTTGGGQIAIDRYRNMYISDGKYIRKISALGIITTIAGTGAQGFSGDGGPATAAQFHIPVGLSVDDCSNVYIADSWNHRIRMVNSSGIIRTIAGNGFGTGSGAGGYSGDGGPATAAELNSPSAVWVNNRGDLYIVDFYNYRIRYMHVDSCVVSHVGIPAGPVATQEKLQIFPNPSYGSFTLNLSSTANAQAHITITDLTGRVIKELRCTTNKDTEIRMERVGLYFVTAEVNGERYVQKVVVQ